MQGYSRARPPNIGTEHDPLPTLLEGLDVANHLRCTGITSLLTELHKAVQSFSKPDSNKYCSMESLDEARAMFEQLCLQEDAVR